MWDVAITGTWSRQGGTVDAYGLGHHMIPFGRFTGKLEHCPNF